jgi:hypothetical protein
LFGWYFGEFGVKWWLGEIGCRSCHVRRLQFLLTIGGGLTHFLSVKSFESFFQEYSRYFEGVPLSYEEFVFDIPDYAAGNMAESEMVNLSKSEGLEYSQKVFLFGLATFMRGKIGVQGVRCFSGSEF